MYTQQKAALMNEYKCECCCCYSFIPFKVRHSSMNGVIPEPQRPDWISKSDFFQDSENYQEENCDMSKFHRDEMISQYLSLAGQIGKAVWHVLL